MIQLQRLTEDELEFARKIRNKYREYFVYNEHISKKQHEEWFARYKDDSDYFFWVIVRVSGPSQEEEYIGTVAVKKMNSWMELHNVILDEKHRGKLILEYVFDQIKELFPSKEWRLEVKADNDRAIRAYEKLGFSIYYKSDDNIVYMRRQGQ
jgi:RimJ/RimL family protein N-acetyltransferase